MLDLRLLSRFLLLVAVPTVILSAGCSQESGNRDNNVAQATPQASPQIPADEPVALVASQVGPSVVQVNVTQNAAFGAQSEEGIGSGVIYRKDGYIITNNHVVAGAN